MPLTFVKPLDLDVASRRWHKAHGAIQANHRAEWEAWCDMMGFAPDYNFGDVLA